MFGNVFQSFFILKDLPEVEGDDRAGSASEGLTASHICQLEDFNTVCDFQPVQNEGLAEWLEGDDDEVIGNQEQILSVISVDLQVSRVEKINASLDDRTRKIQTGKITFFLAE